MRAFVLSGGANRGSLQAGAALALLNRGITPDLIVASSVGAINGACLAAQPNTDGIQQIAERWKTVRCEEIFPGNTATMAWRLLRGHGSFHTNRALRRFILGLLPPNTRRFGDLKIPLFVTSTKLATGEMYLFGHNPRERLLDGLMASCAIPPFLPPYEYNGELYVDGCFVSNLPIREAIDNGATEVWALEIGTDSSQTTPGGGLLNTVRRSVEALVWHQMVRERELAQLSRQTGVVIHHIQMLHYSGIDSHDFRYSDQLMKLGFASAETYLAEARQHPTAPAPAESSALDRYSGLLQASIDIQRRRLSIKADQLKNIRSVLRRSRPAVPVVVENEH